MQISGNEFYQSFQTHRDDQKFTHRLFMSSLKNRGVVECFSTTDHYFVQFVDDFFKLDKTIDCDRWADDKSSLIKVPKDLGPFLNDSDASHFYKWKTDKGMKWATNDVAVMDYRIHSIIRKKVDISGFSQEIHWDNHGDITVVFKPL